MLLKLIPTGTKIPFVRYRKIYFAFSLFLLVLAGISYGTQGLNFGIDFVGGISIEVRAVDKEGNPREANVAEIRQKVSALNLGDVSMTRFGRTSDVLIRVERQKGDESAQAAAVEKIVQRLGVAISRDAFKASDHGYILLKQEFVGPKVGAELVQDGIIATVLALLAIMAYVWFRFEWQFGVAAVVALAHDVLLTVGLFSEIQLEFNLATVAAVLTIAGYSINDTVVVFDRVRENLRKYKKMALPEVMNLALNDTLSRTLLTSITTLLALAALVSVGGQTIQDFAIALIWGVVIGTYSSVCLAVPLLLLLNLRRGALESKDEDSGDGTPAPSRG